MILKRLRSETADQHAAMESLLPLLDPTMPVSRYCNLLAKFYGYYSPLEDRLRATKLWMDSGYDWAARIKTPSLEADLLVLGEFPLLLPRCEALPVLTTLPQVLGCLYVMEGATLGGQIITKHLQANLGLTPDSGAEFFSGYGDQTRQRWQEFGILLTDTAEQLNQDDAIVDSANATFKTLGDWLALKVSTSPIPLVESGAAI